MQSKKSKSTENKPLPPKTPPKSLNEVKTNKQMTHTHKKNEAHSNRKIK